ncbi:MAG: hypothetical protein MUF31_16730 [Akkermansiaceae bacterium]|jgi:hypothetical protein|nr:hypothetical protein [Akkermansiaceae bacterium]
MKNDTKPAEGTEKPATTAAKPQVARVRVLKPKTLIRNAYRASGSIVEGVDLADAEYKAKAGEVQILNVSDA